MKTSSTLSPLIRDLTAEAAGIAGEARVVAGDLSSLSGIRGPALVLIPLEQLQSYPGPHIWPEAGSVMAAAGVGCIVLE